MEEKKDTPGVLDLLICPGFYVKDHRIVKCNAAAAPLLTAGEDIRPLLLSGQEEYDTFSGGILYLSLSVHGQTMGASVIRWEEGLLFLLEEDLEKRELQCLALAAKDMRLPLHNVMAAATTIAREMPEISPSMARLNRGMYQLLRIVGNMSDAGHYSLGYPEMRNIPAVLDDIFGNAAELAEQAGIQLHYRSLTEDVHGIIDAQQLERAMLNILSNAIKFTPKGGSIEAEVVRVGTFIRISVLDKGEGIPDDILGSIFHRYLRQPGIEDSRFGIGLGMVIVKAAAANHGGTVLIDRPQEGGTRVTFTLAIRQDQGNLLRSWHMRIDYAGEWSHPLLELSDCLPSELYKEPY